MINRTRRIRDLYTLRCLDTRDLELQEEFRNLDRQRPADRSDPSFSSEIVVQLVLESGEVGACQGRGGCEFGEREGERSLG